jgi:hypothetical protein
MRQTREAANGVQTCFWLPQAVTEMHTSHSNLWPVTT